MTTYRIPGASLLRCVPMLLLTLATLLAGGLAAQSSPWVTGPDEDNSLISYRATYADGHVQVDFQIVEGWKTYALDNERRGGDSGDTQVALSGGLEATGAWTQSEIKDLSATFGTYVQTDFGFKEKGWFRVPVKRVSGDTATVTIDGQVCENSCLPIIGLQLVIPLGAAEPVESVVPEVKVEEPTTTVATNQPAQPGAWTQWVMPSTSPASQMVAYRARVQPSDAGAQMAVEVRHAEGSTTYAFDNTSRNGYSHNTKIEVKGPVTIAGSWTPSVEAKWKDAPEDQLKWMNGATGEWYWKGGVTFTAPISISGSGEATLTISGMVCDDGGCFSYGYDNAEAISIALPISVGTAGTASDPTAVAGGTPPTSTDDAPKLEGRKKLDAPSGQLIENPSKAGNWLLGQWSPDGGSSGLIVKDSSWGPFIWLCIVGGLVALLMPCVFPMIPITVSFFGKQAEATGGSTLGLGFVYGTGVVVSYTALGAMLTAIFGATGVTNFAGSPWVAGAIAILFFVFALSMFGMFELRLPGALAQKANVQGKASGVTGALLLGMTFAVTSMACTVPVVGSIFALAAGGELLRPLVGMLVFSSVVAAPFVVLSAIPGLLKKMPRAGGWMNNVKVVFGFIELAAAAEFLGLARIISREWVLAIWIASFFLAGLYLLGVFRGNHDHPGQGAGGLKMLFATVFLAFAAWLVPGLFGNSLGWLESFLIREGGWEKNVDLRVKLEEAKANKQPVFLDFTGSNCANCRLFESQALYTSWGEDALKDFSKYALYTDSTPHGGTYVKMTTELFSYTGQPAYVVLNPEGQITAWLADINVVLKADNPEETFRKFVATSKGQGFDWSLDKGFAPPKKE